MPWHRHADVSWHPCPHNSGGLLTPHLCSSAPLHPCPPSEPRQQRYWERQHPEEARPECKRPSCQQFRLSYLFLPLLPRIGGWESAGHFGLRTKASWAQGTVLLLPCC